jgi:hypothetical protein
MRKYYVASEISPSLIGRTVTFAGPNASRITDELTGVVGFADNEEIALRTKNAVPAGSATQFRDHMWGDYWKLPWGSFVEVGDWANPEPSDAGGDS